MESVYKVVFVMLNHESSQGYLNINASEAQSIRLAKPETGLEPALNSSQG